MMRIIQHILFIVLVIIVMTFAIIWSNPMWRSNDRIRLSLLKATPIGTSIEDVQNFIDSNEKWKSRGRHSQGIHIVNGIPDIRLIPSPLGYNIGVKSITAIVGEYRNPFTVTVTAFWGFNENSELIEIAVLKDMDAF